MRYLVLQKSALSSDKVFKLLSALHTNPNRFPLLIDFSANGLKDGFATSLQKVIGDTTQAGGLMNIEGLYLGHNGLSGSSMRKTCEGDTFALFRASIHAPLIRDL